jgi:hypothetical protein
MDEATSSNEMKVKVAPGYKKKTTGFELTTLVVIGTDCTCTGSCKSTYHTITTVPIALENMAL